ncbi:MAG: cofactor-independent phosphoglycerate mutase [Actinomycetota bacterium]|nr:cofactor-independent phosphoglycerate mutase [Actinomycetota bacterium]
MKYCVIILDGAAGWPLPELGGRTTLQAASTPNLDAMAREGMSGLAQTVPEGEEPSSAAACTSILGYDPVADRIGRGAIEAASIGIELAPDEVALRLNLVTLQNDIMASYAGGHISTQEAHGIVADLAASLDDDVFRLYPGVAYRHILVVKGHPELMGDTSYTPPHDISDKSFQDYLPRGAGAALLIDYMTRARPILANSGINACRVAEGFPPVTDVWPFWPGVAPKGMAGFIDSRGVRPALTSGVDLLNGLAVLAGIDRLDIPGVSDGPDNDYAAQAEGGLAALADHDLVVIHVESPDEAGHSGDVAEKLAAIESIDREVVARALSFNGELRILAMPDHPTPIALKTHVGEAVPFVLYGPGVIGNGADGYDESSAGGTGVFVDPGRGVMDLLLDSN